MQDLKHKLKILQNIGVASVFDDTLALASIASRQKKCRVLDLGTGTGYIAIYLAKLGFAADGADINQTAIKVARINARKNHVRCRFFVSDLFSTVKKKYGMIVFNPPLGNEKGLKPMESVKSIIRRSRILTNLTKPVGLMIFKKDRRSILKRFFLDAGNFITNDGCILLLLNKIEVKWYESLIPKKFKVQTIKSPLGSDDHVILKISPELK